MWTIEAGSWTAGQNSSMATLMQLMSSLQSIIQGGLSWVEAAYDQLEPKDRVTVSIGTVALVFSALSFIIAIASFRQKTREGRYALRKQLTDTVQKLLELNTEYSKSTLDESKYPRNYGSLINDQRRFHARQAELMTGQIRRLVSKW